ncbi:Endonuclease 2 [Raphanus sativus]|uniref:Aspergillus nuclease S1 n=1 Tax=Raphanus sativus TaxID=3726 RepID=A0A6J0LBN7_RAPSA|nr:endonuclease 2 [Raphanus sativus]KAJ4870555.1 Endonuclease 2 [Raphanus sativus]
MANQTCLLHVVMIITALFLYSAPNVHGWGIEGHTITCRIAQARLDETAAKAVKELLPESAQGDLSSLCDWADRVKFRYHWSSPLHYINTPDVCSYQYNRDCKDEDGVNGRCVAGAIYNYTTQLLSYNTAAASTPQYNLTEALLFLSHFMGDIHQPLHVSFASDKGGNTIEVHWYTRKANLHHIWDSSIIQTAEADFYNSELDGMVDAINKNITTEWADQVSRWESCTRKTACPDIYASEGIKAACDWAYKGVTDGDTLEDEYFYSRLPIVYQRLAQGGVRLAATLNKIFGGS